MWGYLFSNATCGAGHDKENLGLKRSCWSLFCCAPACSEQSTTSSCILVHILNTFWESLTAPLMSELWRGQKQSELLSFVFGCPFSDLFHTMSVPRSSCVPSGAHHSFTATKQDEWGDINNRIDTLDTKMRSEISIASIIKSLELVLRRWWSCLG